MKQPKIKDFIQGKVTYDVGTQYFLIAKGNGGVDVLGELRGWGSVLKMFRDNADHDVIGAAAFQDELGQFVADAINEKMHRTYLEQNGPKV